MFVKCNYMGWIWIRFFLLGIRNMFFFLQCIIHVDDHKRIRFSFSFPLRKILLQDMFIERLRIRVWFFWLDVDFEKLRYGFSSSTKIQNPVQINFAFSIHWEKFK